MSRNGSGIYNLPAGNPVVTGTTISSTWANSTLTDIASALTGSLAADGQTPMTGALDMNNNKIENVTPGAFAGDAIEYTQFAEATATAVAITGGTINGTTIGLTTPAASKFTNLEATGNIIGGGTLTLAGNLSSGGNFSAAGNGVFLGTGSLKVPTGTTAQRNSALLGSFRFNTTYARFEGCIAVTAGATISTITRVTTTATVTTSTAHGLTTGDFILVSGATPTEYNGTYAITVTSTTEFTYVMATSPATNATVVGSYVYATWGAVGGGATGSGNNQVFVLNDQTVTGDYTVPTGKNASSAGPITIDTGITVTVSTDSTWVIV